MATLVLSINGQDREVEVDDEFKSFSPEKQQQQAKQRQLWNNFIQLNQCHKLNTIANESCPLVTTCLFLIRGQKLRKNLPFV